MPDSLKGETLTLRGADAMWKVNYTGGQRAQLFLYTGDVTVTVHAPDEKVARQAADWLRSMNELGAQSERALLGGVTAICSE